MRPRVSDASLEALLHQGNPVAKEHAVSKAERAALLVRLSELPSGAPELPRRRLVGLGMVTAGGMMFSVAVGLGIWLQLPKPKPLVVASVLLPSVPTPLPSMPTLLPSMPTLLPSMPTLSQSIPKLSQSMPRLSGGVLKLSRSMRKLSRGVPKRSQTMLTLSPSVPEPVVTHILISADSTCRPGDPKPESIVIHGDATSIVTVTTKPEKEKETEVSL